VADRIRATYSTITYSYLNIYSLSTDYFMRDFSFSMTGFSGCGPLGSPAPFRSDPSGDADEGAELGLGIRLFAPWLNLSSFLIFTIDNELSLIYSTFCYNCSPLALHTKGNARIRGIKCEIPVCRKCLKSMPTRRCPPPISWSTLFYTTSRSTPSPACARWHEAAADFSAAQQEKISGYFAKE
jgi:hypothetical protein